MVYHGAFVLGVFMIIPRFWAEWRIQQNLSTPKRRTITIKRFGWSDVSQEEAQTMAVERAKQALEEAIASDGVRRLERKVAYNGHDGLPIRERIVETQGPDVVTRNSYGARCLNTPDVFFADIDTDDVMRLGRGAAWLAFGMGVWAAIIFINWGLASGWLTQRCGGSVNVPGVFIMGLAALGLGWWLTRELLLIIKHKWVAFHGGTVGMCVNALDRHVKDHPQHKFRVYRTPAGARVMALHQPIDPKSAEAQELFSLMGSDPLYVQMCKRQDCYRARVSGKPWRMDVARWRGPVWPFDEATEEKFQSWVTGYEKAAAAFSACRWAVDVGQGATHPRVGEVMAWHDQMTGALEKKPLA